MSAAAPSAPANRRPAVALAGQRRARPNGWWGMAVFVATEATLFGTIFGAYFYLRFHTAHWPPRGLPEPTLTAPLILTAVLVSTTIPLHLASRAARAGRAVATRRLLALALLVQVVYFGFQLHLFLDDLDKLSPSGSAYASIYFTMLGAHHAHVVFGMLMLLFLVLRLGSGLTRYRTVGVQSAVFYWYFVNVLALCVAATQVYAAS